jgi:ribosomal protein L18E
MYYYILDRYFQPKIQYANYHDVRNWYRIDRYIPLLHAEMLPSDEDMALFFAGTVAQVQIDAPIQVGAINYSNTVCEKYILYVSMDKIS